MRKQKQVGCSWNRSFPNTTCALSRLRLPDGAFPQPNDPSCTSKPLCDGRDFTFLFQLLLVESRGSRRLPQYQHPFRIPCKMAQSIKEELTIKEESIKQEPVKEEFEAESTILESSPQMSASSPPVSPRHVHPLGGRPQPETSLGLPLPPVSATGGLPLSAPSFELPPRPPAQQTERPAKRRR